MFKSIKNDKLNYTGKVVNHIKQLILDGQLKPGDKLPPERELAQLMDVSRPTIRESFKILSGLGFVDIKHGQGVFVKDPKDRMQDIFETFFNSQDSVSDLFEMRKVLETQAAYWAAERATPRMKEKILKTTKENYDTVIYEEVDIDYLEQADHNFHYLISESTGNAVYLSVMKHLMGLLKTARMHTLQIPGRPLRSLKEHQLIAEAIYKGDPPEARRLMYEHLNSVEETLNNELDPPLKGPRSSE
ncbi:GntR family transcriptional repressor for pyruvate dehydrogenase complex [Caldalkalibacillus uzonensis]|uniref:GntR family transcriptional repressor for pyruvate dehydrogenase complex n=1 Tax=Caldalkalibacillus uzonensis TaxID=353224 RepID=A0ABU0CPD8_9BACI|nr:FadR/GntR family transcriptional regulator [Caldalkalibacillus uzonensis]MDQ0337953.1 GntR family transcriptional repressor for pyruvate dehydrogenase complex [Caldalkalibacillus uzonensis]